LLLGRLPPAWKSACSSPLGLKVHPKKRAVDGQRLDGTHARRNEPGRAGRDWTQPLEYGRDGPLDVQENDEAKGVATLPELYEMAVELGVKMMPCQMSMDVMEFNPADFQDNVTGPVGVAAFLEEAAESKMTLFI
jgi:hypothetical protein